MNDDTILGGALNQLGQTVKQAAKQVVKLPEEMGRDAGEQIGGSAKQNAGENKVSDNKSQWQSDEERVRFLKDLYGSAQPSPGATAGKAEQNLLKEPAPSTFAKVSAAKPEEQKELVALRNQLHKEVYYDPTFNPVKKQEERPAEKVEMEKRQEMQELEQKDAKKPPPLAVQRERNKAEMFRGPAG